MNESELSNGENSIVYAGHVLIWKPVGPTNHHACTHSKFFYTNARSLLVQQFGLFQPIRY